MAGTDTFIFRAAMLGRPSIHRDIEFDPAKSLYKLAESIVTAFDFDFDHAFGFYSGLTRTKMHKAFPRYELFADIGEADPGVHGVEKTRTSLAFPEVGHTMLFLFDYGDEWLFKITLRAVGSKVAKVRYPRVVATKGTAPPQYEYPEEDNDSDGPTYGVNPLTGEKTWIKK